jgi:hypothetical protein
MAQVSKQIRLLLQIKIGKKKKSQMNPGEWILTGSWEPLVIWKASSKL